MGLRYTATTVTISDDLGNRPPLTFPLQQQTEINAAIAAYHPPPPPAPDWDRFQADLQTANGFPTAWGAIFSGDPRPGIGLISALLDWRATGQWTPFLGAALACLALLPPDQAAHVGLELLALATDCNLDPAFCEALETLLGANS